MKKLLIFPILLFSFAHAETIQCKVTEVIDGSTIRCLTDKKKTLLVEMADISPPELNQTGRQEAKQFLFSIIEGKNVLIETHRIDGYKTLFGTILYDAHKCPMQNIKCDLESKGCIGSTCGIDVGTILIQLGYAWYSPFDKENSLYKQAEKEARDAKHGL